MRARSAGRLYYGLDNVGVRVRHVLLCSARRHGPHRPAPEAQGQGRVAEKEKWPPSRGGHLGFMDAGCLSLDSLNMDSRHAQAEDANREKKLLN